MREKFLNCLKTLLLCFSLQVGLQSCASLSFSQSHASVKVEAAQDVFIVQDKNEPKLVKSGEKFEVSNTPVQVFAPGKTSVTLLPAGDYDWVTLDLQNQTQWLGPEQKIEEEQRLAGLLKNYRDLQIALTEQKASEALAIMSKLDKDFPNLSYLRLIRASVYLALGQNSDARRVVSSLPDDVKDSQDARELRQILDLGGR